MASWHEPDRVNMDVSRAAYGWIFREPDRQGAILRLRDDRTSACFQRRPRPGAQLERFLFHLFDQGIRDAGERKTLRVV